MIDLQTLTTVAEADAAVDEAIERGAPDAEFQALLDHRDQLYDAAWKPPKPAPRPIAPAAAAQLAKLEQEAARWAESFQTASTRDEKEEAVIQRKMSELQMPDLRLAAEFNDLDAEALELAREDARVRFEELSERLTLTPGNPPEGSARRARLEREHREAFGVAERAKQEAKRRQEQTRIEQVRAEILTNGEEAIVQSFLDKALGHVTGDKDAPVWEVERAREIRGNPAMATKIFDKKFRARIRSAIEAELDKDREQGLRNFASEGHRFFIPPQDSNGNPLTPTARAGIQLIGEPGSYNERHFVEQIAGVLRDARYSKEER
jgi:DNA-binding Lrp family transcriptional regulator